MRFRPQMTVGCGFAVFGLASRRRLRLCRLMCGGPPAFRLLVNFRWGYAPGSEFRQETCHYRLKFRAQTDKAFSGGWICEGAGDSNEGIQPIAKQRARTIILKVSQSQCILPLPLGEGWGEGLPRVRLQIVRFSGRMRIAQPFKAG